MNSILKASQTQDIEEFLNLAFPPSWDGIAARILESGVTIADHYCKWAPRWSQIPFFQKTGNSDAEIAFKTVIYRVHDCIHQLWGLPHPQFFHQDEFFYYKRAQMCGEVAVLTLTEFVYAKYLYDTYEQHQDILWNRNAIPLLFGPLKGKTTIQIGMRLDDLMHKKSIPKWVRDNSYASKFVEDYVPMLERDRQQININWEIMKNANWLPELAPNVRYHKAPLTVRNAFAFDGNFHLSWVEGQIGTQETTFTATANLKNWKKIVRRANDLSFNDKQREWFMKTFYILQPIIPDYFK